MLILTNLLRTGHENNVPTHALRHMMYGYTSLVPMN